eukprot:CCRYP_010225-RA/>CCRYP_010225-RA protein AED:0.00 eAED:0.00 QI:242/-1/1/1/-1/1/1/160/609
MAGAGSPRNFTFDDDSSAISSVMSSNISSVMSSNISSAISSPVSTGSPRKNQPRSPRKTVTPSTTSEENVLSPSILKKRSQAAERQQQLQQPAKSTSRPADSSNIEPLTPSARDKARNSRENRDDVEGTSTRASRRFSPRKKSVLNLAVAASRSPQSPSPSISTPTSPKEQRTATTSEDDEEDETDDNPTDPEGCSPRSKAQKKLFNSLREPDRALKDLLAVLTDQSISQLRRVNACGAIKTLTLNKSNQVILARTRGVVSTITSVLCRVDASEEERTRCINALMHLSVPEKNWRVIYLFPQTPEALARNMADRYPRIRYAACLAMSFLAKKNRVDVVSNRIIMYSIARVLEVDKNGALERVNVSDRKVFVGSRLCALKMLLHLSKNKDVSMKLARTECIPTALVNIANKMELAANILCVATLTNLTRHPENCEHLVYNVKGLLPTLLDHITSNSSNARVTDNAEPTDNHECAKCALYALQNLSCSNNCRQELANTPNLLAALTKNAFKTQHRDQQLSALHTLKNLSDDPFNLVTMTNTPGCTATLLALANDGNNVMAQYLACDTLATLSHWLLTLSTAKTRKSKVTGDEEDAEVGRRTFQTLTWEMWQ